ncbi:peptidoglycan-binding LysM [Bifidobacterium actinocoloniiforme DSM 22766]|uniref:Peptidoglycan-binding LysM n=1 Tax=Bifidobacterium actinocoloniiforme DSM 22766 TaxID=1437605 RepID=A0A086YZR0_9BIFI|nr:LysM peptidoglycan-binding domain-containing protein [Bifidobacterium actinocoloniiforme]AKV55061.1 hypothetical protein AB656_00925 [Bifidobacterium actinocoloniiforme DSM 22766]KFI39760.1 peptidoglycan-binding LysM [Bifidobacterium actinocoloniiforme DSM 22766]
MSAAMITRVNPGSLPTFGRRSSGREPSRFRRLGAMILGLALALSGAGLAIGNQARSDAVVQEVTAYTVRPGDTLWTYAKMVTPAGGDVSETVDQLMELNGLSSPTLQTGQRLVVPKR